MFRSTRTIRSHERRQMESIQYTSLLRRFRTPGCINDHAIYWIRIRIQYNRKKRKMDKDPEWKPVNMKKLRTGPGQYYAQHPLNFSDGCVN